MNQDLSLVVLGSSSSGNSTLVWNEKTSLLVDCGLPPFYMMRQFHALNMSFSQLAGVFITHTHGDHVNNWMVRKLVAAGVPLFCPAGIELHLQGKYEACVHASRLGLLRPLRASEVEVGGFLVRSFEVPHDSPGGCFGYNIFSHQDGKTRKITIATDIGYSTDNALCHFLNSQVMVIESNHDVDMLETSGRPVWLKRRIREIGHLSNDESAAFSLNVLRASKDVPTAIVLAHISQQCNRNEIALKTTRAVLSSEYGGVKVVQTHKSRASGKICV